MSFFVEEVVEKDSEIATEGEKIDDYYNLRTIHETNSYNNIS